ncbi:MAG: hypothetical protein A4E48_02036 [Methanosaeta sp. PtaU1.Bin060]|nr:MAG: hypothetical protein A4E48_02036 [Methanosaeta sp. PtaU1.Bin060]
MVFLNWNSWKKNSSRANSPSKKGLGIAFSVAVLLLSLSASADVPVEGMKQADYTYVISNIKDYPEYVFLTSSVIWGWKYATIINSTGTFGGGYKLDSYEVHAIRASDFDRQKFLASRDEYDREIANCTDYCRDNPKIISSNLTLPKATSVKEIIPLKKIEVDLRIDGVTDEALKITRTKMLYYYENGTVQELAPE